MIRLQIFVFLCLVFVLKGHATIVPENDLYIGPNVKNSNGLSQQDFNTILDHVQSVYEPIVAQHGGQLVIRKLWSDGTVNAQAYRQGRQYIVEMFGGLARHPAITKDALYLVACHEIGHHIGGAPHYSESGGEWASVEGQADYFATTKCLRKVFANDNNTLVNPDPVAKEKCEEEWGMNSNAEICTRASMAGHSAASMFSQLGQNSMPSFSRRDNSVVRSTYEGHPQPQCRLDTYFDGALCAVSDSEDLDRRNPNVGACSRAGGFTIGTRPLCWYKPVGGTVPTPNPNPSPNPNPNPNPMPPPDPGSPIADQPLLNGQVQVAVHDPRQPITISYDVSRFRGAYGVYIEISAPNQGFSNPNGTSPDPRARGRVQAGTRGSMQVIPARILPGWGVYQVRVIPLDQMARFPVGQFSNSSVLQLTPGLR